MAVPARKEDLLHENNSQQFTLDDLLHVKLEQLEQKLKKISKKLEKQDIIKYSKKYTDNNA